MKLLIGGLVVALALTGCATPASDADHGSSADAEATGDHGAEDEIVVYPAGFPTDLVPMFDGTLLHVSHPGNLWAAWIESEDLVADLATASQQLIDAGYTQTAGADGWGDFANDDRSLRIIASVDATYGSSLMYTITDGATEAENAEEQDAHETEAPADH